MTDTDRSPSGKSLLGRITNAGGVGALVALYVAEQSDPQRLFRTVFLINGAILLVWGVAWMALSSNAKVRISRASRHRDVFAIALITLIGALMRVLEWQVFPPSDGQFLEEAQTARNAFTGISSGRLDSAFPLAQLIAESGFRLFGTTMTGLRIPFVILGILSVPVFYVASRLFLRTRLAAIAAALLFATNATLAGSSRVALETMHPIFSLVVALAATFYAARQRSTGAFFLAGLLNGFLLLEYDSYRLAALLNSVFLFLLVRPESVAGVAPKPLSAKCVAAYVAAAILVLMPLFLLDTDHPLRQLSGAYFDRHIDYLAHQRAEQAWTAQLQSELWKLQHNIEYLWLGGYESDLLPARVALIDPYTGVVGLLGALCGLASLGRAPRLALPALSIAAYLLLGTVMVGHVARYRLMPTIPYCLLGFGILIDVLVGWRAAARRRFKGMLAGALLIDVVIASVALAGFNIHRFFAVAVRDPMVQRRFYDFDLILTREIARLQIAKPKATIVLLTNRAYLGTESDYSFQYDLRAVKVVRSADQLAGMSGILIAHDSFIPAPDSVPGLNGCERWKTRFDYNEILHCRLGP